MTAAEILDALVTDCDDTMIWASELALSTGARRCDFWTIAPWQSKGYLATAYEIKVSRADYRRDTHDKQREARLFSDRFYYVTPAALLRPEEIPDWAGLIEIADGKKFGRIATFKHSADAAYVDACNPVAISAILAEARKAEAMGLDRKRETQLATDMASDCLYEQKRREAAEARIAELEAFLSKLCDYHDADYVPNALFARARTLLNGGSDAQG